MRTIGKAGSAANVLLVGLDGEQMGMVREVLSAEAVLPNASVPFGDALAAVKRARPHVVVVAYTQAADAALALAQAIVKEQIQTTMVALAAKSSAEAVLAAVRSGYKEFCVLPDDAARLRHVVHESAFAGGHDEDKGVVVAFTGSKGGVGTTTVLVQVAAELASIHKVLILDLDLAMGDVAAMLDLTPRDSIAELLTRADRLDERALTGSVVVHRSKVHVLAGPEDPTAVHEIRGDDVYAVINAAAAAYQYVLIDCGDYLDEATGISMNVADIVVLVTNADVPSVRDAFRKIRALTSLGIQKERLRLVVNRWSKTAYVSLKDIQSNLNLAVSCTVAEDTKGMEQAVNEGKLLREVNKRSEAMRDISSLVAVLTDTDTPAEGGPKEQTGDPPSGVSGFFASLFNRG